MGELADRGPNQRDRWYQKDCRKQHAHPRPPAHRPPDCKEDKEIDGRIFEEVDAIGEKRDRAGLEGDHELDEAVSEVEKGDAQDDAAQCGIGRIWHDDRFHILSASGRATLWHLSNRAPRISPPACFVPTVNNTLTGGAQSIRLD